MRDKLETWFNNYCRFYYTGSPENDRNIRLKEEHTGRVCENIRSICLAEQIVGERAALAEIAALFHDVGRFEQYRRYGTFRDSDSVNHAGLSAEIVEHEGLLDELPVMQRRALLDAVRFHNLFTPPLGLPELSDQLIRLVRDADKLDIWRVFAEYYESPPEERASAVSLGVQDIPEISTEILESIVRGEMARLAMLQSLNDFRLLQLSWVFDLNFSTTFRLAEERGLLLRIAAGLPESVAVSDALQRITEWVQRKSVESSSLQD